MESVTDKRRFSFANPISDFGWWLVRLSAWIRDIDHKHKWVDVDAHPKGFHPAWRYCDVCSRVEGLPEDYWD
jgi:hypothetical protein